MTPSELIKRVTGMKPSSFSLEDLLGFLTQVEQQVADQRPDCLQVEFPYSAGGVYILPEHACVRGVYRDGIPLPPVTEDSQRPGYVEKEGSVLVRGPAFSALTVWYTLPVTPFAVEDMDTRQLLLPAQWADVYLHYLSAQIELYTNNISMYANHAALFNQRFAEFTKSLYDNRPQEGKHRSCFYNLDE